MYGGPQQKSGRLLAPFPKGAASPRCRELISGTVYKSSGLQAGTADGSWVICLRQSGAGANSSPPKWSLGTWRKKYAPVPRAPKENNQEREESGTGGRLTGEECKHRRLPSSGFMCAAPIIKQIMDGDKSWRMNVPRLCQVALSWKHGCIGMMTTTFCS